MKTRTSETWCEAQSRWYSWANPMNSREDRALASTILAFVRQNYTFEEVEDWACCTTLAESIAQEMGHDEWLDDTTHIVWDVAVDVYALWDLTEA